MFGQWDHDYPDRPQQLLNVVTWVEEEEAFPEMIRYDWMQDLLEWFEYYLQERGPQPGQWIEVQDNTVIGEWNLIDIHLQIQQNGLRVWAMNCPMLEGR